MLKKLLSGCLLLLVCAGVLAGCGNDKPAEKQQVRIAAAASLEKVFTEKLIPMFNQKYPDIKIEGTYDSSGKLQTQIEQGLAADIFVSAATKQMQALTDKGYMDEQKTVPLLENKLVLIVPSASDKKAGTFTDIANAGQPAIGDPKSVPAGQYAKEALEKLGLWQQVSSKASLGTNVTEVLHWVAEGSADAGVVYATDAAASDKVKIVAEAPAGVLAKPVIYPMGILKQAPHAQAAAKFYDFLRSKEAAEVFEAAGFAVVKQEQ